MNNNRIAPPLLRVGGIVMMAGALVVPSAHRAHAEVFDIGSTFTDSGNNSPSSYSQTVTLQPGNTSLDGGALNLNIKIVPTGDAAGDEWLVFTYQTTSGALVPPGDDWAINQTGLDAAVPVNFVGAFDEFLDANGHDLAPTSSVFGQNIFSNPVPGGTGIGQGELGFVSPIPAGPIGSLGAYIDPFDQLDGTGIPSASVDGFVQALEFQPQTPPTAVPEPTSIALLGTGLLGLLGAYRPRHRR